MLNLWIFFFMGQCLRNKNCSKWKGLENFIFTSWGSLSLLDPREHGNPHGCGTGAHSDLGEHSGLSRGLRATGPVLPQHGSLGPLSGGCCRELATRRFVMMQKVARERMQSPISIHADSPRSYFLLFFRSSFMV